VKARRAGYVVPEILVEGEELGIKVQVAIGGA
jgi:hypothetical protein